MRPAARIRIAVLLIACLAIGAGRDSYTLERLAPTQDYFKRPCGLISYNGMTRTARWTLERIDRHTRGGDRAGIGFHKDADVPAEFAAAPSDYAGSGRDIGHQIPAADSDDVRETFTVANACPQTPELNRGPWKTLEARLRLRAQDKEVREIWIVTAPAWLPARRHENGEYDFRFEAIGAGCVWVPTHCLKSVLIVHADGSVEIHSWRLPNIDDFGTKTTDDFAITTDQFESDVGLDVWRGVAGEKELEAAK